MKRSEKVAVILLNWRNAVDTVNCIESLIDSGICLKDIIVVDNDSQDNSGSYIASKFPSIEIIESGRNGGFSYGCNVGIRFALSRGYDLIWLLNNDTIVNKHTLPSMIKKFEGDQKILVGSIIRDMDFPWSIQAVGGGRINFITGVGWQIKSTYEVDKLDYLIGASILIKSDTFHEIGLLDESFFMYWEDTEFSIRARKKGYKLEVAEGSNVYHKEGGSAGKESYGQTRMVFTSMRKFFFKESKISFVPIIIRQVGKTFRSLARRDIRRIPYIWF